MNRGCALGNPDVASIHRADGPYWVVDVRHVQRKNRLADPGSTSFG
jgi:hypothetical protein